MDNHQKVMELSERVEQAAAYRRDDACCYVPDGVLHKRHSFYLNVMQSVQNRRQELSKRHVTPRARLGALQHHAACMHTVM